ncbi:SUMF1/EgtB/PvdO family nonheme iron enzyme [Streptomyces geranii]|uniref:SUMF1/EgtB/PvdO family nonheme iron enzyme n=1 Tax=Streptomyces geranii TaxID=2058923 RepID=UPI000D038E44|nr:SUMF1/EgtB/PvdO family nonheme iron enzyme [Streptomyces geranii]
MRDHIWFRAQEKSLSTLVRPEARHLLGPLGVAPDPGTAEHIPTLARAIYDRLTERRLSWSVEPFRASEVQQGVRSARAILRGDHRASCLDISLLYAGCCLGHGLVPLVVVLDGHALVAVSLRDRVGHTTLARRFVSNMTGWWAQADEAALLRELGTEEAGRYLVVECTGATRMTATPSERLPETLDRRDGLLPFEAALRAGRRQLAVPQRPFLFALDVFVLRDYWLLGDAPVLGGATEPSVIGAAVQSLRTEDGEPGPSAEQLRTLADHGARTVPGYQAHCVAAWRTGRGARFDPLLPRMSVVSQREQGSPLGQAQSAVPRSLAEVLGAGSADVLVLLGSPGSGKTTLLHQVHADHSLAGLRRRDGAVSVLVPLRSHVPDGPDASPLTWLSRRLSRRHPGLPPLEDLLAQGDVLVLLDGLNELTSSAAVSRAELLTRWHRAVEEIVAAGPRNRVIASCRTLDYEAGLGGEEYRTDHITLLPPDPDDVVRALRLAVPETAGGKPRGHGEHREHAARGEDRETGEFEEAGEYGAAGETREDLVGVPDDELRRAAAIASTPYALRMLSDLLRGGEGPVSDRAQLFAGMLRAALRREHQRDNRALLYDDTLLDRADRRRLVHPAPAGTHELPGHRTFLPAYEQLALTMQQHVSGGAGEPLAVLERGEADRVLGAHADSDALVQLGFDLGVLDEDIPTGRLMFSHQLLQDYFSACALVRRGGIAAVLADRPSPHPADLPDAPPWEPLGPLPAGPWSEPVVLATVMSDRQSGLVAEIMDADLFTAARCAIEPGVTAGAPLTDELRRRLLATMTSDADLRVRLEAGRLLGRVGDPRFRTRKGPYGHYVPPELVVVPGGPYLVGWEGEAESSPVSTVRLDAFALGTFPVTNAEYACFLGSGGYDDLRWWPTESARRWLRGLDTRYGHRTHIRLLCRMWGENGVVNLQRQGYFSPAERDELLAYCRSDDDQLSRLAAERYPDEILRAPEHWTDPRFNGPNQPVIGLSFYEATAYTHWLAAQTGVPFRLPTEAEWEAAARGPEGRERPCADHSLWGHANTLDVRLRATSPVGMFPAAASPCGAQDMCGNSNDRTSSIYGPVVTDPPWLGHAYPYDATDGREDPEAPVTLWRIVRGTNWRNSQYPAGFRVASHPTNRGTGTGMRLAAPAEAADNSDGGEGS